MLSPINPATRAVEAKHLFESEQHLDDCVGVDVWSATFDVLGFGVRLV